MRTSSILAVLLFAAPAWAQSGADSGGLPAIVSVPLLLLLVGMTVYAFLKHPRAMMQGLKNIGNSVSKDWDEPNRTRRYREEHHDRRHGHYPPHYHAPGAGPYGASAPEDPREHDPEQPWEPEPQFEAQPFEEPQAPEPAPEEPREPDEPR